MKSIYLSSEMKNKKQSLSGLSNKDKIMECFEKDMSRKELWRKFPNVTHKTIRQYHWEWKKRKEAEELKEKERRLKANPMYAAGELIRDFIKPHPGPKPKSKEEHVKKPTTKLVPVSISNAASTEPVISSSPSPVGPSSPPANPIREEGNAPENPFIRPLQKQLIDPFAEKD